MNAKQDKHKIPARHIINCQNAGCIKTKIYYYPGRVRPTIEETAIENIVCYILRSQEKGITLCHRGPPGHTPGKAPGLVRKQREGWGEPGKEPLSWFLWEEMCKSG